MKLSNNSPRTVKPQRLNMIRKMNNNSTNALVEEGGCNIGIQSSSNICYGIFTILIFFLGNFEAFSSF